MNVDANRANEYSVSGITARKKVNATGRSRCVRQFARNAMIDRVDPTVEASIDSKEVVEGLKGIEQSSGSIRIGPIAR
ncbi:hypothetical protein ACQP1G_17520 [Nocardia sp. CA-107356]|uniref:hypothetical protein n=1 Tax=Nocardia sp. CA-107356 TaxID=3239972 RepID=UPI003D934CF5